MIWFRGEHGYAEVRGHRPMGRIVVSHPQRCHPGLRRGAANGVELTARSDQTFFSAYGLRRRGPGLLFATTSETVGQVSIFRLGIRDAREGEFTYDDQLTSAHVEPGGPTFSGSADFSSPRSWTGSLTASFPGAPGVPMAGPDFRATLNPDD